MPKELREQIGVFGESDDAIANVAGRKHVQFFAKPAAGAAIVADGDNRTEFADAGATGYWAKRLPGGWDKVFETLEQGGETGTTTDGHHAQWSGRSTIIPGRGAWPLLGIHQPFLVGLFFGYDGLGHGVGARIGVEQFREARILRQVLEIGVISRLKAQSRIEAD